MNLVGYIRGTGYYSQVVCSSASGVFDYKVLLIPSNNFEGRSRIEKAFEKRGYGVYHERI
jgi:hypothetical protein